MVCRALGDTLIMEFSRVFLELWLKMTFLELRLKMEGKHVTFLELWFRMVGGTNVSVRVMARTEGFHLIKQSQVVTSDVLIFCREYKL